MHTHNYALEVLVNGRPVQEYYKDQRSFIEARSGTEYTLRFRNNSWKRVLAIFSVDGIEVLKGKAAAQADNGYVVDAFSTIEIKGYRIDDKTVAAFKFSGGQQSYSVVVGAETKDPVTGEVKQDKSDRNNGVIGVRVFEEDVADHDYAGAYKKALPTTTFQGGAWTTNLNGVASGCSIGVGNGSISSYSISGGGYNSSIHLTATNGAGSVTFTIPRQDINQFGRMDRISASALFPFRECSEHDVVAAYSTSAQGCAGILNAGEYVMPQASACSMSLAPDFDLGTAWGEKVADKVREVKFKKVATSVDLAIYYASRQSLESWGIDFSNTKQVYSWPAPFEDRKQYCKLPPGYKV